jgi:hypothetical protein
MLHWLLGHCLAGAGQAALALPNLGPDTGDLTIGVVESTDPTSLVQVMTRTIKRKDKRSKQTPAASVAAHARAAQRIVLSAQDDGW